MSWVIPVLQFAYGFFRGVEQGYADRQAGRRLQNNGQSDYDWQQHMVALSNATGLPLVRVTPNSAAFNLQLHGQSYVVALLWQGQTVQVSVCSCITFPSGRAPNDISAGLSRFNRQLEHCDFELIHGNDGDFYCVQGRISLDRLSPDAFHGAVTEMLSHVLMLERYLLERGYAS